MSGSVLMTMAARRSQDQSKNKIKYLKKEKVVPFDLSSGGSLGSDQASDLEFELELELYGPKPKVGS